MTIPTTLHLSFKPSPCGGTVIDKTSPEPFKGSVAYLRGQGWLPIESAPTDWTDVLVFDPELRDAECNGVYSGWFSTIDEQWYAQAAGYNKELKPTHWQPLPAAPEGEGL